MNNAKPPLLAVIREAECIGCTKCIAACPADAILGTAKWMHTVIADECIGCKLCVAPCPVDCIDMIPMEGAKTDKTIRKQRAEHFKKRYQQRQARQLINPYTHSPVATPENCLAEKKAYIQAALERVNQKKKGSPHKN